MSIKVVPLIQSNPFTKIEFSSMSIIFTIARPIGLGLLGVLIENIPLNLLKFE